MISEMANPQTYCWILGLLVSLLCITVQRSLAQPQQNMRNVAKNKNCTQSSYYYYIHKPGDPGDDNFATYDENNTCHAANNGNTSTSYGKGNCIFTHWDDYSPHWTLDLGQDYVISKITVYARGPSYKYGQNSDNLQKMRGVKVSIDGGQVYTFDNDVSKITPKTDIPISPPRRGRTVDITRLPPAGELRAYLNFCEVQIWVCNPGFFGTSCTGCGSGCASTCDAQDGSCTCGNNWKSPLCEVCNPGFFGTSCTGCGSGCASTCDAQDGSCTCGNNWKSPLCEDCDDSHYNSGNDCKDRCGHCKDGQSCDKVDGHCPRGCDVGWKGALCQQACDAGYHGDCSTQCGAGCDGTPCNSYTNCRPCDAATGHCTCRSRWGPDGQCDDCVDGRYNKSNDCSGQCGHCTGTYVCDKDSGHCNGCEPGWQTPLCQQPCSDGQYGQDCRERCGQCVGGQPCDRVTGSCTSCQPGVQLPLCKTPCKDNHYGVNCNKTCGRCAINDVCNKTTGNCPGSCQQTFKPPLCDSLCEDGSYGDDCKYHCGHCGGDEVCDKDSGHCTACQPGWSPPLCQQACQAGLYGSGCNETCGHCRQNVTCSPDTGLCNNGCDDGFDGHMCDLLQSSPPSSPAVGVAVGVVVSLLLAAGVVVAVVVLRRRGGFKRQSKRDNNETDDFSGPRSQSESSGDSAENSNGKPRAAVKPRMKALGSARTEAADHAHELAEESAACSSADTHLYGNITSTSSQAQKASTSKKRTEKKNGSSKSAGSASAKHGAKPVIAAKPKTTGPVYENVELGSMMQAEDQTENRKSAAAAAPEVAEKPKIATKGSGKDRPEDDDPEEKDVYSHEDLYACYSSVTPVSLLDKFQKYLLDCLASPDKLAAEFEKFPPGMPHAHTVGSDPANTKKNRFKKLCAYDKNRVLLKRPAGDKDTDYINANYIKGHNNEKAYIATQGPRSNTMGDLWWMIWQDDVTQIVMLTNLKEDGKDKCDEYWPAVGKTVAHGHVIVKATDEEERADFVIRTFILKVKGSPGKSREVQQYLYQAWPDHGVPAAGSLVNFWRYVTARAKTTAPPVVHCSAGVGRTGTYIALDIAMDRKSRGNDVSVKDIVTELREQRSIMVQTEVQYKFLHEVILEAYTSRDTRLTLQQLDDVFPADIDVTKPNKRMDQEFRLLKEIKRWAKPHHTNAELEENKHKNRDPRVLPDDDHLAYLNVYVRSRNQYINAVFMSWFKVRKGLLLTQLPLPDTMVDLWRLVEGCGVNTILSLGGQQDHTAVPNYCQYWPQNLDEVLTIGPYRVSLTNSANLGGNLKSFTMDFKTKDNSRQVRVLRFTGWSGELPGNTSELLHLVDTLNTATEDDTSPVVIQCQDGATRSGLFCVLLDVISRMTYDGDVDVFPTVRYANSVRPEAVTSEEQYRYCYKVAQEFKRTLSVYANT